MTSTRIFGTDGVRGRAGEGWLTPANVSAIGRTAGALLKGTRSGRALVGHDGRRSGPELEAAFARGLAASGFTVVSAGLITTPGLAWLTRRRDFALGAMLSASHNAAHDNGIKLFSAEGEKLSDALEFELERRMHADPTPVTSGPAATLDPELEQGYVAHLIEHASAGLVLDGWSVVVDCANGGGSRIAPRVLARLGARVIAIHAEPDGDNINRGCGSTHVDSLIQRVRDERADAGFALDGDGDRCILVDERGEKVDGDGVLTICARAAIARNAWPDRRVVATVMSNKGLHRALREVGVGVVTVDVGDRNVVEALRREKLALGGEQSGHVVFGADNDFIGDGTYTALRVLRAMRDAGQPLSQLAAPFCAYPQVLVSVPVAIRPRLDQLPALAAEIAAVERELGDNGRVLVRYSGTEPIARVMVEGPLVESIERQAQRLARTLADEIAAR